MIEPTFDRILLQREKLTKVGSIHIPEAAAKRHAKLKCKVLAMGWEVNDKDHFDGRLNIGDTVFIARHSGDWVKKDGTAAQLEGDPDEEFIVSSEDIIAIERNENARAAA